MSAPYIPEKYITLQDALGHLGWNSTQINAIDKTTKDRYQNWVRQANNIIEGTLFKYGDNTPLVPTTKEYSYAIATALDWVVYKQRDKEGSKNATNARDDHKDNLDMLISLLTALRTDRTKTVAIFGKKKTVTSAPLTLLPSQIDVRFG